MDTQYFVFCQSDLVLERHGDNYLIPTNPPTEIKPWTTVMDIDGAKAYRIDRLRRLRWPDAFRYTYF